jgi:hypothetical protein
MKRSFAVMGLTVAIIGLAARALATSLADVDPLFAQGFVPPDGPTFRGERGVAAEVDKLGAALRKCHDAGVQNAFRNEPSGLAECIAQANERYRAGAAEILPPKKQIPPCLDPVAEQAFAARASQAQNGYWYCAGTVPLTDLDPLFGAGFLPPDAPTLAVERAVARALARLGTALHKCHAKAVLDVFKGEPGALGACIGKAGGKYSVALTRLKPPKRRVPDCLRALGEQVYVHSLAQGNNAFRYCAAP